MNDMGNFLMGGKERLDNLEVPEELEGRLKYALDSNELKLKNGAQKTAWYMKHKAAAALLAFVLLFAGFNYDALAYYGKKIIGYDKVTFGAIKDLNELGLGQVIGKTYTFKDGSQVILDGVMYDDNQLIAFYRTRTNSEEALSNFTADLKGFFKGYHQKSGYGIISEDKKEIAWNMTYEKPLILDKNLTLDVSYRNNNYYENGKISFTLDKSKAMGYTIKGALNQSVEVTGVKYNFKSITATPLSVVIEGNIEGNNSSDFLKPTEKGHFEHDNIILKLQEKYLKNGEVVIETINSKGGELGGSGSNFYFKCNFDGLKSNLKDINLVFEKVTRNKIVDKQININSKTQNYNVIDNSDEIVISNVSIEDNMTSVTFITPKNIEFDTVLSIGNKFINDDKPTFNNIELNRKEYIEKTYHFNAADENMKLLFKELSYVTYVNKEITLPLEK